jgi:hypothetical protein
VRWLRPEARLSSVERLAALVARVNFDRHIALDHLFELRHQLGQKVGDVRLAGNDPLHAERRMLPSVIGWPGGFRFEAIASSPRAQAKAARRCPSPWARAPRRFGGGLPAAAFSAC